MDAGMPGSHFTSSHGEEIPAVDRLVQYYRRDHPDDGHEDKLRVSVVLPVTSCADVEVPLHLRTRVSGR